MTTENPVIPHIGTEFMLWLWWKSETGGGYYNFNTNDEEVSLSTVGSTIESIDLWVDKRIAMRSPNDTKITTVLTGENPSTAPEAKVALAQGGKVIAELRLGIRTDDREYFFTLKGPALALAAVKLPSVVFDGEEEVAYERMHLLTELDTIIAMLFVEYAIARTGPDFDTTIRAIYQWLHQE